MYTINTEKDVVDYCLAGGEDVMIFYHYPISNVRLDRFSSREEAIDNTVNYRHSIERGENSTFPVEPQDIFKIKNLELMTMKGNEIFLAELTKVSTGEKFWTWQWIYPHETFCKIFHILNENVTSRSSEGVPL